MGSIRASKVSRSWELADASRRSWIALTSILVSLAGFGALISIWVAIAIGSG
jgi:hypothetical protein